jgi:tRNA-specific 2-thiouridylase
VNWILFDELKEPLRVTAKTRYSQKEAAATVEPLGDSRMRVVFDEPQRALTTGQAVVLYQGDYVVGGGTIRGAQ